MGGRNREAPDAPENHFLRRARNHEVRRSRRKRTAIAAALVMGLRLLCVGTCAFAIERLWHELSTSPRYALDDVQLLGVHGSSRGELLRLLARFRGTNLFALDLAAVAAEAERHPWVWEASVRRKLPDAIEVAIRERVPYALARIGDEFALVDREGAVLGSPSQMVGRRERPLDFPVVTGVPAAPRERQRVALVRSIEALKEVASLAPEMMETVSEVNVEEEEVVRLVLRAPSQTLVLSDGRIRQQLVKYFMLKDAIVARVPHYRHVDLRFKDRVIVRTDEEG